MSFQAFKKPGVEGFSSAHCSACVVGLLFVPVGVQHGADAVTPGVLILHQEIRQADPRGKLQVPQVASDEVWRTGEDLNMETGLFFLTRGQWTVDFSQLQLTILVLVIDYCQLASLGFAPGPRVRPIRFNVVFPPFEHEAFVLEKHPTCRVGR